MSLSLSLAASLPREGTHAGFELPLFWRRSLIRAVSARLLASISEPLYAEEAFLCGLLQEIGRFVLARSLPEHYAAVTAEAHGWPTSPLERRVLGFDHLDVAHALIGTWDLPPILDLALGYTEHAGPIPGSVPHEVRTISYLLQAADRVTDLVLGRGTGLAFGELHTILEERLRLPVGTALAVLSALDQVVRETAEMLDLDVPDALGSEATLTAARQEFALFESERGGGDDRDPLPSVPFLTALEEQVARRIGGHLRPLGVLLLDFTSPPRRASLREAAFVLLHDLEHASFLTRHGSSGLALLFPGRSPRQLEARGRGVLDTLARHTSLPPAFAGGAVLERAGAPTDATLLLDAARRFQDLARARGAGSVHVHPRPLRQTSAGPGPADGPSA